MSTVDDQLAWEARQRPRAAAAAFAAAILTLAAGVISGIVYSDIPSVSIVDALGQGLKDGPVDDLPSLRVGIFEYLHDNGVALVGGAVASALGYFALAYALTFLASATRARRSAMPAPALYVALVGAVLYGLYSLLAQVSQQLALNDFLDGERTVGAAEDVGSSSLLQFAQVLYIPAAMGLALGFVFVGLNAMRAGLLTRFMGALGIMLGVLLIFPLLPYGSSLMQIFWLGALGMLFLGRLPTPEPPAWKTGEEQPWPSSRELRMAREAEHRAAAPPAPDEQQADDDGAPSEKPHPTSKKRKRKRRN